MRNLGLIGGELLGRVTKIYTTKIMIAYTEISPLQQFTVFNDIFSLDKMT